MNERRPTMFLVRSVQRLSEESYDDKRRDILKESAERLEAQHILLKECRVHIEASAGAEHMLDGFNPTYRPIDMLVKRLKQECA